MTSVKRFFPVLFGVIAGMAFSAPVAASLCESDRFEGNGFIVCTLEPEGENLELFWRKADGEPYRAFSAVADAVKAEGRTLVLAINGGMYRPDYSPSGLYIEEGIELAAVNTAVVDGPPAQVPNFFKRPNGVFYIDAGGAGVLPTDDYLALAPQPRIATQSGPMLVIDGALHPAFIEGSSDRTRRSGVGVCENGMVRLAITDGQINFFDFGRLFRDHLGCPDALFLDGGQGAGIYHPALRRNDWSWHGGFGPILGVVE